ncbi:hypothetical protein ACVME8_009927 [Bradyrhizobium diazoefficiens]
MSIREYLAGFRHVDLIGLGRCLQPRGKMLSGASDLVDLGKLAGDHIGDDVPRMEADPNLKSGIPKTANAPDKLDGSMAGQRRMVVVGDRGTKDRGQAVPQLLADDAAELAYRAPHGRQRRLQA